MAHVAFQWVTAIIIGLNVLVYCIVNLLGLFGGMEPVTLSLGHVPSVANDIRILPQGMEIVPDDFYGVTALTSAFIHVDFWHLAGNMLFIYVFGDNVEDAMGHARYALFFIACAIAACWLHVIAYPQSDSPLVGASGAAAGIVAAYLMLHPKMKVWVLFLGRIPLKLPALYLLGGWVAYQVFMFVTDPDGVISWAAHVGGIVAGLALVTVLRRPGVPLFDRAIVLPEAVEIDPDRIQRARAHGIPVIRRETAKDILND